jgi:hypothetical protein
MYRELRFVNGESTFADDEGHVVVGSSFSTLSLEESIKQDFAVIGVDHLESLSHRTQSLLQKALGGSTLVNFAHCCASRIVFEEPLTVKEAMASEHAAEWRKAMDDEIDSLIKFNCFERVKRSEALEHGKLVKSKWVFKVKYNEDGSLQRFKARLVAKGFTQVPGSDYYETFSPVFSYGSFRTILSLATAHDLRLDCWDLKNSFLQQKIDVDHLYMEVPDGLDKLMPDGQPAALHCLQSLYGLKQASRLLHERLKKYLVSEGFKQLVSDKCVFVKGSGDSIEIVATWVDDIILATARGNEAARVKFDQNLRKEFEVSPWTSGEANWILNMRIQRDWDKGTLHLSQEAAIEKLALRFGLTDFVGRGPSVPMDPNLKLVRTPEDRIIPPSTWDYQSAVGGLLYIALTTRPDIAYATGVLSRFMSCPGAEHVEAAKQVIRYLYGTKEFGILYSRSARGAPHAFVHTRKGEVAVANSVGDVQTLMVTYADADLAGDDTTRRSTSGYGVVLHGGLVSWLSKLQSTVALSTAEAETNAGVEAVKQILHMRLLLRELGFEQVGPSSVFEDNNCAISLVHGKEQSKRARHYQMKVHFLNEQVELGTFAYVKVGTKDQVADTFTKALPREDFQRYRRWMGVQQF